jgi:hypothetical protein|uniref:Uncharacterized protein n=1 Tax=Oryza sativa subsp. japonica TaxID=39947 RepID=Q6Z056_ORYSJ|nr:hypothetical protein [Oryza sativa Japonica Group]BAD03700.1 hypothetical protein [Oryza sativa Japonica Group]
MVVAEFREDAGDHAKQERGTNRTRANSKQASGVLLACARRGEGVRHAQLRATPPSSPCRSLSVLMLHCCSTTQRSATTPVASFSDGRRASSARGRPASSSPARGQPASSSPARCRSTRSSSREDGRRDHPHVRTAGELLPRARPPTWRGYLVLHDPFSDNALAPSGLLCVLEPSRSPRARGAASRRARPPCAVVAALLIEGEKRKI